MTTLHLKNSISRPPWRGGFLLIPLVLACFALLPRAQAATPELLPAPAPDGAYTGFNTAEGLQALFNVNTAVGQFNTALGFKALRGDTTGAHNTGVGAQALLNNNTGGYNTAVGENALVANTTGSFNMALGQGALAKNLIGSDNTAMGFQALTFNTASDNTAVGYAALLHNTTGRFNVAQGDQALYSNATGSFNTAIGFGALYSSTNCGDPSCTTGGNANTAIGESALVRLTTGGGNTAIGESALVNHMTGNQNIVVGYAAGQNLTDGGVNIYIANQGVPAENTTIRIGNVVSWTDIYGFGHPAHTATYIAGISGVNEGSPAAVFINTTTGQLGTTPPASSRRFKKEIQPMAQTSEAILGLKPVTFHYKSDTKGTPQFGLIAEEVAKANPDLVIRDEKGEIYSVRYEAVNAMLLNEFLKEHKKVEDLKKDFQATIAQQQKQIEALTAGLQKVSAQIEASKPAPQTVVDNH